MRWPPIRRRNRKGDTSCWLDRPSLLPSCSPASSACQEKPQEAAKPERPVLVQTVAFETRTPERTFVATIRPRIESDLGFRVPGKIARRLVNVGDAVKAGQSLAVLDETDLRLQREQAEAEMKAASAALAQAEAELKRIVTLREDGWSTASGHDRQKAATEEARGRVARAERALSLAQNALSYATLAADSDGVITATQVEPGQVVTAGQPAIRLARSAEKEAVIAVPEAQTASVRDAKASLTLWSVPNGRYDVQSARTLAFRGSDHPHLSRSLLHSRGRRPSPARDDGDRDDRRRRQPRRSRACRSRPCTTRATAPLSGSSTRMAAQCSVPSRSRPTNRATCSSRAALSEGDKVVTLGVQKLDAGQRLRIVQAL